MNGWKPIAVLALVIGAIGLGVGIATGDGTDPSAEDDTTSTSTVASGSGEPEEPSEPSTDATPLTEAYSPRELQSKKGDLADQCVETGGGSDYRGLDGELLESPAVFDISYSDRIYCGPWRIVLPVEDFEELDIGRIGWADNAPDGVTATFSISDALGAEPLYEGTFTGPGAGDSDIDVDLSDSEVVILEWRPGKPVRDIITENVIYRFVLDGAYVR